MRALFNCPYCGCHLKEITNNDLWLQKICPDQCTLQYYQMHKGSFDGEIVYINFATADFRIYVYFEENHYYRDMALVYPRKTKDGIRAPILKIPAHKIDTAFLEQVESNGRFCNVGIRDWMSKLNDKLKMYVLFS